MGTCFNIYQLLLLEHLVTHSMSFMLPQNEFPFLLITQEVESQSPTFPSGSLLYTSKPLIRFHYSPRKEMTSILKGTWIHFKFSEYTQKHKMGRATHLHPPQQK